MHQCFRLFVLVSTLACLTWFTASTTHAQDPGGAKVSAYAPAKDAESQLGYYLDRIASDLASEEEDYAEDQQDRVALDATTVAVLALTLGMHDGESAYKKSAATIIELAVELADSSSDLADAKEKFAELKDAVEAKETGDEASWEPVADLVLLMKQVPIVNNSLRRGVTSRRFSRSIETTAGHAVTLAAIAQASLIDTSYCGDEEDEAEWQRICAEMRDASAEVYAALLAKDQAKATASLEKIVKTCDDCHHKFRD